jgi:hypothetical protein
MTSHGLPLLITDAFGGLSADIERSVSSTVANLPYAVAGVIYFCLVNSAHLSYEQLPSM